MKNMMKKTLSVIIALAMILVPMSVFAAEGDADQPYQLSTDSFRFSIYVAPGATAYVQASDSNNSVVTVGYVGGVESGEQSFNYSVQYGRQYLMPDMSGAVSFSMMQGYDTFTFTNNSEEQVFAMMTLQAAPSAGTWDNPQELVLEDPMGWGQLSAWAEQPLEAGNQGYYYTVTAPDDGALFVSIDAYDAEWMPVGWMYNVNNTTAGVYGDTHFSDDAEPVYREMVEVSAGDKVDIFVTTYDPADMWNAPAGTVAVDVTFETVGGYNYPAEAVLGSQTAPIVNGNGYHYVYTATEDGTATVTMNDEAGWQYALTVVPASGDYSEYVYGETHWSDDDPVVASESMAMKAGDTLEIAINTYDPEVWGITGDVNWTFDFVAGEIGGDDGDDNQGGDSGDDGDDIGGGEEPTENYVISDETLVVGENDYAVDAGYEYTVYVFEPTEEGKYTITSDDLMGIVGYHWVNGNPTAETVAENEIVWECTSVGQSIYVAVKAATNATTITVTREDLAPVEEVPWTIYENVVTPEPFTFEGNVDELVGVDFEDDVVDTAVLGDDGYYHLNSADGPILYVSLDDSLVSMLAAYGYGQMKAVEQDENLVVISKTDYNEAFAEYVACADADTMLYPLTDDLIEMIQNVGAHQGWYTETGAAGTTEDAWLFLCYYVPTADDGDDNTGNDNTGDNAGDDNTGNVADPEIPNTGAETLGVAFAMMATAAALGATVVTKKSKRVK